MRHSGFINKLKFIGVGSSVPAISQEFLIDRRQRVQVSSEWMIPVVSGVRQDSALGPLLLILYTSEMFDLLEI